MAAIDTLNHILGLGRGVRIHTHLSREDHTALIEALAKIDGVTVTRKDGTSSFCHGAYSAPWWKETISGAGYELAVSWSQNAATGADNGIFLKGDCPQWRVNTVRQVLYLARPGGMFRDRNIAELRQLAAGSEHPEEAAAATAALAELGV
jgi:hypothetical protein